MKKTQTLSLQDQLLKSGLTNDNKIKQIKADKRKQTKQKLNQGIEIVDEVKLSVEQARLQQVERDRVLNQQRKEADEHKALLAQIRELVDINRIHQDDSGLPYQFNDTNKVKKVYVTEKVRSLLVNGRAGIIKIDGHYHIVPIEIAHKIYQRDEASVIVLNQQVSQQSDHENDPYADYQIPDDLIW